LAYDVDPPKPLLFLIAPLSVFPLGWARLGWAWTWGFKLISKIRSDMLVIGGRFYPLTIDRDEKERELGTTMQGPVLQIGGERETRMSLFHTTTHLAFFWPP
jgi:hypothetical protein